jgi:hypothetical protein
VVDAGPDAVRSVVQSIKSHRDISVGVTVERAGAVQTIQVLPDIGSDGAGKIGVQLAANADLARKRANGAGDLLARSAQEMQRLVGGTLTGLGGMLTNLDQAKESVSGPVAVVAVGAEVARESPTGALRTP